MKMNENENETQQVSTWFFVGFRASTQPTFHTAYKSIGLLMIVHMNFKLFYYDIAIWRAVCSFDNAEIDLILTEIA